MIHSLNTLITNTGQPSLLNIEQRSSVPAIGATSEEFFELGGYSTYSGNRVNEQKAMSITAVHRAVSLIAGSIAMMPLQIFSLKDGTSQLDRNHYLNPILGATFDSNWTAFRAKRFIVEQILLRGNAICKYVVSPNGRVVSITPLHWDRVTWIPQANGSLVYLILDHDGKTREYTSNSILHFRNIESNDFGVGLSTIEAARNTMGLSIASEEATSRLFSNGLIAPGFLRPVGTVNEKTRNTINEYLKKNSGSRNAFKTPLFEANIEYIKTGLTLKDAQFIDTRKMTLTEICILFGLHPSQLGLVDAPQSSAEQNAISFLVHTLQPIMTNIETEIHNTLLSSIERKTTSLEFDADVILRTDSKSRFETYATGVTSGVLKPSEARRKEKLPHDPDGDDLVVNGANVKLRDVGIQWSGDNKNKSDSTDLTKA
jgi:HK97 family phage portal protein